MVDWSSAKGLSSFMARQHFIGRRTLSPTVPKASRPVASSEPQAFARAAGRPPTRSPTNASGTGASSSSVHSKALIMPSAPLHDYRIRATIRERDDVTIQKAVSDPIGFLRTPQHAARQRSDRVRISYCAKVDGGIKWADARPAFPMVPSLPATIAAPAASRPRRFEETWLFVPREWFAERRQGRAGVRRRHVSVRPFPGSGHRPEDRGRRDPRGRRRGPAFGQTIRRCAPASRMFRGPSSDSHREKLLLKAERLRRSKPMWPCMPTIWT